MYEVIDYLMGLARKHDCQMELGVQKHTLRITIMDPKGDIKITRFLNEYAMASCNRIIDEQIKDMIRQVEEEMMK